MAGFIVKSLSVDLPCSARIKSHPLLFPPLSGMLVQRMW